MSTEDLQVEVDESGRVTSINGMVPWEFTLTRIAATLERIAESIDKMTTPPGITYIGEDDQEAVGDFLSRIENQGHMFIPRHIEYTRSDNDDS